MKRKGKICFDQGDKIYGFRKKKKLPIQKAKVEKEKLENILLTSSAQLQGEFATELIEDHFSARKIKFRVIFLRLTWTTMTVFNRFTVERNDTPHKY